MIERGDHGKVIFVMLMSVHAKFYDNLKSVSLDEVIRAIESLKEKA